MQQIVLNKLTIKELQKLIRRSVRVELKIAQKTADQDTFLSISEACKLFTPNISRQTLRKYTKQGLLQDHNIGSRPYYKKQEVLNAARTIKRFNRK